MTDKEKVLDAFKNTSKSLRPGDIAKSTGIESKEVSKIIKELSKHNRPDPLYMINSLISEKYN